MIIKIHMMKEKRTFNYVKINIAENATLSNIIKQFILIIQKRILLK